MFFPLDGTSSQSDKNAFKNRTSLGLYRITVYQGHTFISDQINTEKKNNNRCAQTYFEKYINNQTNFMNWEIYCLE